MSIKDKYTISRIRYEDCKEWLLHKHYAHRMPAISYAFGLFDNNNILQGIITFGMTANNNLNEIAGIKAIELNRLITNDNLDKNSLSHFVSYSLKMLPKPIVVISYADSGQGHHGYIYQATNWLYTGLGCCDYEFVKNGKQYHRKNIYQTIGTGSKENAEKHGYKAVKVSSKHRYIYLLGNKKEKKEMLKALKYKICPYPKGQNQNYDASYQPEIQGVLF